MLEIGKILKEERERRGLSVQDISVRTHFNISQIEAIERGDLDFFKDDLSYVKFFVQFYCKALGIDFAQFKDEFEDDMRTYTTLLTEQEVQMLKQSNENIKNRVKGPQGKTKKKKKMKLRTDASVISLLIISMIMVAALSFAFGRYILPNVNEPKVDPSQGSDISTKIPEITYPENTTKAEETTVENKACVFNFYPKDTTNYVIKVTGSCNKSIDVMVKYNHRTWVDSSIDDVKTTNPKSNYTFQVGDIAIYSLDPLKNKTLRLNMGYFKGNQFFINDEKVELDTSVSNSISGRTIYFSIEFE